MVAHLVTPTGGDLGRLDAGQQLRVAVALMGHFEAKDVPTALFLARDGKSPEARLWGARALRKHGAVAQPAVTGVREIIDTAPTGDEVIGELCRTAVTLNGGVELLPSLYRLYTARGPQRVGPGVAIAELLADPAVRVPAEMLGTFGIDLQPDESPAGALLRVLLTDMVDDSVVVAAANACAARAPEEYRSAAPVLREHIVSRHSRAAGEAAQAALDRLPAHAA